MALKEFETQLGEKLFDRVGRRLILNESGRAAVPMASEIIGRTEALSTSFAHENRLCGNVILGASSTIGNYILPEYVADFIHRHTEAGLQLEVGNTEEIISKVRQFEVDAGFIEGNCCEPGIKVIPWIDDELAVFAAATHPLAGKKDVRIKDLEACNWILREKGSGTREIFENRIHSLLIDIHVLLELGHTEAIKSTVAGGSGVSCLSLRVLEDLLLLGRIKVLKTPFLGLKRKFYLIMHQDKYETVILKRFLSHLNVAGINRNAR